MNSPFDTYNPRDDYWKSSRGNHTLSFIKFVLDRVGQTFIAVDHGRHPPIFCKGVYPLNCGPGKRVMAKPGVPPFKLEKRSNSQMMRKKPTHPVEDYSKLLD